MRRGASCVVAMLSLAVLARARDARGDPRADPPPPLHIAYVAPAGCPDALGFFREVRGRTKLARLADPGDAATLVDVRVEEHRPRATSSRATWTARVVLEDPAGHEGRVEREIQGGNCGEVVIGIGLIVALALDPAASLDASTPPPVAPAAPAAPPPAAPPVPAPPPPVAAEPAVVVPEPRPARVEVTDGATARATSPPWRAGVRAVSAFGVAPGGHPLIGGAIAGERVLDDRFHASLRLEAELAATGDFGVGPGGASFLRGGVRVEGCAFALAGGPVSLTPCLGLEAGGLRAQGVAQGSIQSVDATTLPWFAAGFLPRLGVRVGRVILEAQGGPVFPFVRDSFVFASPAVVVYRLPAVTGAALLGADVSFP